MSEPTELKINYNRRRDREPDFTIEIRDDADSVTVRAGFSESYIRNYPAQERLRFEPTEEELAEMDPEERAEMEQYDPESEYKKALAELMKDAPAIREQADILADALAEAAIGFSPPEEARTAFTVLRAFMARVEDGTAAHYASLPPETKHLIEYIDRITQLEHLYIGSTYVSPMDQLYSPEEAAKSIEDFFVGAEKGLEQTLSADEKTYAIHLERPKDVRFINATSNMFFEIAQQLGVNPLQMVDGAFRGAVRSSTEAYRRAS